MMKLHKKMEEMLLKRHTHISMHVPGHKNNTIGYLSNLHLDFDMTEIDGMDDLHEPTGILQEVNQILSGKYPGYHAQMMVNGTTNGILSAVYAVSDQTERYFIVDSAHKSVYHALKLLNCEPVHIKSTEIVNRQLDSHDTIIITYPTYSGETIDVSNIIQYAHNYGTTVITDEAHGAHLDMAPDFPKSSMKYDSDITIQSYHKMLPALTMASVIFTKSRALHDKVMKYINYFETSSPSYLIMLSIESAQEFYDNFKPELFNKNRKKIIQTLKSREIMVKPQNDPTKLILNHPSLTPYELAKVFTDRHIYHEMVTDRGVLWCLPLFHNGHSYPLRLLLERISSADFSRVHITPAKTDLEILKNKTCIRTIVPYPPGVPLVHEGETITDNHMNWLSHYVSNHVRMEGIQYNLEYYKNEDNR